MHRLKKKRLITLKELYEKLQIAVKNYFIIHGHVNNNCTDFNTLIPVLEKYRSTFVEEKGIGRYYGMTYAREDYIQTIEVQGYCRSANYWEASLGSASTMGIF